MLGLAAPLCAAPAQHIDFESRHDFRCTNPKYQKEEFINLFPGGFKGKCFRLFCPKEMKSLSFHNWTHPRVKVPSSSAGVKFSIYLKGKGTVSYGFFCYDINKKNIYPPGTFRKAAIDSKEWKKYTFTFTPEAGKLYANKAAYLLPYLTITSESLIFMDEIQVEFEDAASSIKIEE